MILALFAAFSLTQGGRDAPPPTSGPVPFILSGNRVYAQVEFLLPGGAVHKTFVFVDLGSPAMVLSKPLFDELHVGAGRSLDMRIGRMTLTIDGATVSSDSLLPFSVSENRMVEGVLPAGVLRRYQVRLDYAHRTITVAQPGTLAPEGTSAPIRVNEETGLVTVDATIDGAAYPLAIDNGSGYTWVRQSVAQAWLARHPDWVRGTGAVGPSNMRMADDGIEARGTLLRISGVTIGGRAMGEIGALAIAPDDSGHDFLDWYSRKTAAPVIGWLGGNMLRAFRVTIDYPARVSYWHREMPSNLHELEYVGLTLRAFHGEYFVAGIATRNGTATVVGAQPGDKLLRIGGLSVTGATRQAVFAALHGKPGERRSLLLERDGRTLQIQAEVTAF